MMPYDFPQFAELWREQIDPDELRRLQAMARKTERTARRKHLLDLAMSFVTIGLFFVFMWVHSVSPPLKLGIALIVAALIWRGWRRREITKASRAAAIHDPDVFFKSAIKNARAEIKHSTADLWMAASAIVFAPPLMFRARGFTDIDSIFRYTLELNPEKTMLAVAIFVLSYAYYVRENLKLREQLRRLEGMRREWNRQEAGDPGGEGPDDTPIPE